MKKSIVTTGFTRNPLPIVLLLLLAGCTAPFDIQTDDSPPVIVIYGELTDELKYQEVMISRSSPYFDDVPNQGISNAIVTLRSSDNEVWKFLESDSVGLYCAQEKFKAKAGVTYSLSVEVGFDNDNILNKYEAETTVLPTVTPDSLSFQSMEMFGHRNHLLFMHFQVSPEDTYYVFNVTHNDSLLTAKLSNYKISDNTLFKGQYIKGQLHAFDDMSNWENDSEERRKESIYLQTGDKVEAAISLIPKGFYEFISQCQKEKSGENPMFGGPASNIATNISNGGVGYFVGYCTAKASIVYK